MQLAPRSLPGFIVQKSEDVYLGAPARLAEWKKQRGHYEGGGGIRGVSVKVPGTKSMRAYYGGLSQRTYVQGAEGWTVTDEGTAVITSKRIVFKGGSKNIEWAFAKLVGADIDEDSSNIVLRVSNRQRSHVLNLEDLETFVLTMEAALARFQERPAPTIQRPEPPPSLRQPQALNDGLPPPPPRLDT